MNTELPSKLQEFVNASRTKGASDEFLATLLIRRGWPADDVYAALGEYWAGLTGIPVPERATLGGSAREAFLYLLAFATLCCWTTALGSAMFTFINHWFPDPVSGTVYQNVQQSVTWQMATLVVAFPIFLFVMRAIINENALHPDHLQSGVRKWLTYCALLGTTGTMVGDLIWFLNYLLSGEITARFFFKTAVVLFICGAIFLYYFRSLRSHGQTSAVAALWNRTFATVSTVAVLSVFFIGLTVAGTPSEIRHHQADTRRVEALEQLGYAIEVRCAKLRNEGQAPSVPATLTQLIQEGPVKDAETQDPQTHRRYEYRALGGSRYELCATFSDETRNEQGQTPLFWRHGEGRTCYALDATKPVPN